ncbi:MAG: CHAT domain-containing protein, partial [bacterium]
KYSIFSNGVKMALMLYSHTKDNKYKEKAYEIMEKSKAHVLQEMLVTKNKAISYIPDSLQNKEKILHMYIETQEEKLKSSVMDSTQVRFCSKQLFQKKQELRELLSYLDKNYTKYHQIRYKTEVIPLQDVQANIREDQSTLVEFFSGDTTLTILTVTPDTVDIVQTKIDTLFQKRIRDTRKGIIEQDYELYTRSAYQLYQMLIEPIEHLIQGERLILVPDGLLSYLPFDALLTNLPESDSQNYKDLSYLFKDYAVTYTYSATQFFNTFPKNNHKKYKFLGFAPVSYQ